MQASHSQNLLCTHCGVPPTTAAPSPASMVQRSGVTAARPAAAHHTCQHSLVPHPTQPILRMRSPQRQRRDVCCSLLGAAEVLLCPGVDLDDLACVDEQGHLDAGTRLQLGHLAATAWGAAADTQGTAAAAVLFTTPDCANPTVQTRRKEQRLLQQGLRACAAVRSLPWV